MSLSLTANPRNNDKFFVEFQQALCEITVTRDKHTGRVRLLFDAPQDVRIDREKIYRARNGLSED